MARERRNRTRLHDAIPPVNKGAQRYVRYVGVAPSTDTGFNFSGRRVIASMEVVPRLGRSDGIVDSGNVTAASW